MDNLDIAYHEAAHAVMAHLSINLNFGLALYPGQYVQGVSLQKFRIQKYLDQDPVKVRQTTKDIPKENEFIQEQIKAIIIILHAGTIAQNIFLGQPPKLIPDYVPESDDEAFGKILVWYCQYADLNIDAIRMRQCFYEINLGLYEEMKANKSVWILITKLAVKLYKAKDQKLSTFQTNRNIFLNQLKQAFSGRYYPKYNIDILGIIKMHCT